jgi:hypothetical protein
MGRQQWRVELVRARGGEAREWIMGASDAKGYLARAGTFCCQRHAARRQRGACAPRALCIRYSPLVTPDLPDGVFIDVAESVHLFKAEQRSRQTYASGLRLKALRQRRRCRILPGAPVVRRALGKPCLSLRAVPPKHCEPANCRVAPCSTYRLITRVRRRPCGPTREQTAFEPASALRWRCAASPRPGA